MSEFRKALYWATVFAFTLLNIHVYSVSATASTPLGIPAWMGIHFFLYQMIYVKIPKILKFKEKKDTILVATTIYLAGITAFFFYAIFTP